MPELYPPTDAIDSFKGTLEVEQPVAKPNPVATGEEVEIRGMDMLEWAEDVMAQIEREEAAKDLYSAVENLHTNGLSTEGLRASHAELEEEVRTLRREKAELQREVLDTREALAREQMQREADHQAKEV